jgi:hypothetical protein
LIGRQTPVKHWYNSQLAIFEFSLLIDRKEHKMKEVGMSVFPYGPEAVFQFSSAGGASVPASRGFQIPPFPISDFDFVCPTSATWHVDFCFQFSPCQL